MAVQISGNDITVPRDGTFTRNVTIGGTLTYEDVTNIDSVGLVTARTGIEIGARPGVAASISVDGNMIVSGISTFGGNVTVPGLTATSYLSVGDDDNINLGDGNDLKIYHQSSDNNSYIENDTGNLIIRADAANKDITLQAADLLAFNTGGANERARIDSSGKLLVNHTSARIIAGGDSLVQVEAVDSTGRVSIVQNRNEAEGAPFLSLGKSRGTSVGSNTVVQSGDTLGTVAFAGADGTDLSTSAVQIVAQVDGTPGSNDMPGRLIIKTCADGASSTTERVRIDSSGNIMFGTTSNSVYDDSSGSGVVIRGATGALDVMRNNDHPLLLNRTGGDGQMIMYHRDGTNKAASALRSGHLCFDLPSGTEKIRFQSTGGISFNGDTATANALDDYEEGSWQPQIGGNNMSVNHAHYTKIGNFVHLDFDITGNASANGNQITGLPFTAIEYSAFHFGWVSDSSGGSQNTTALQGGLLSSGGFTMRTAGGNVNMNVASGQRVIGCAQYRTS